MKILISPAKSLDFEKEIPISEFSQPEFIREAESLMKVLKSKNAKAIKSLMGVSDAIADLNVERNLAWRAPFTPENARQALYCFTGSVYQGLDVYSLNEEDIEFAQKSLRILSGLYGMLKPLDLIQPYRLEMGTSLKVGKKKNLYQFWNESVTLKLNSDIKQDKDDFIVNLASAEYYKVIKEKLLHTEVITPVFKEFKNGSYKVIMVYAKLARGLMTRYIIQNRISNKEDIKNFNVDGYVFSEALSNDKEWVFTR